MEGNIWYFMTFLEQFLVHRKIKKNVWRLLICLLPPHIHPPYYQHPPPTPVWCICYNWWTNVDRSLSSNSMAYITAHSGFRTCESDKCIVTRIHLYNTIQSIFIALQILCGLPWWLIGKESACQGRGWRFEPVVRKIPWSRKWQPTPVFLPGKSHG